MQDGRSSDEVSTAKVVRSGDGFALVFSDEAVALLGLKEGDEVVLSRATDGGVVTVERMPTKDELFARVREIKSKLPADYKFDRDEANARGSDVVG